MAKGNAARVPQEDVAPDDAWTTEGAYMSDADIRKIEEMERQEQERERKAIGKASSISDLEHEVEVQVKSNSRPQRAPDVWTLDDLEQDEPVTGDLRGDGSFIFHFRPIMGRVDIQKKLRKVEKMDLTTTQGQFEAASIYTGILGEALIDWPLHRKKFDEDGNPVLDADGEQATEPLPLSQKNVDRLSPTLVIQFFTAIQNALRGEVSGQDLSPAS